MPLEQSGSNEARSRNIAREREAGKSPEQAAAIGYAVQRKNDDDVGEHTTHAAGILFVTREKRALFLKRGPGGDHPGEWCFPGGRQEQGESNEECAIREAEEEVGKIPSGELVKWTRAKSPQAPLNASPQPDGLPSVPPTAMGLPQLTDFTTYKMEISSEFVPAKKNVDEEHVGYAWAPVDQPPEPLHPGARIALQRFGMTELDVANAIMRGELASPQRFNNVWLFNIRITGTGAAYRHKLKEYVWRDASFYMNDRFLQRCNGLPVIFEHPKGKKAMLDTKEFNDRIVGTTFVPYLKPEVEEVWAVVKIYDEPTAILMEEEKLSTSPAVVFTDPTVNTKVKLEDGNILLIEGEPQVLDHIAICEQGVWDKGGEPRGVEAAAIGDSAMVDKPAADTAARKDDDEKEEKKDATLDKILAHVDNAMSGLSAKMDARMDGFEKKMDARFKKDDDDDAKKKDSRADAKKKDDDDDDEEEEEEGKAKAVVADKKRAKKDAKKDDDDDDDAKKKDDDEEEKAEKKEDDDDDDAKKDARSDSVTKADLEEVRRLIPKSLTDEEWAKFANVQEKADNVASVFGDSAPRPLQGETLLGYRRRLLTKFLPHSARWKGTDITKINDDGALAVIEDQVYADAAAAALKPTDLKAGQLREVIKTDRTGRRISEFVGNGSFIRQFKRPGRRVQRFGQNNYAETIAQPSNR